MKYSLRNKLSFSHITVVVLSVVLIMILSNFILDRQFRQYAMENQDAKNKAAVISVALSFRADGTYDEGLIDSVGMNALENGLILKVKDKTDKMIWDATIHNNGMCMRILEKMAENLDNHYYHIKGQYMEVPFPIKIDNKEVGTLFVGYYGPFSLNDNDINFLKTLNKLFAFAGLISMILSFLLGSFMSKKLSGQISKVINVAQMISKGNYDEKVSEESNTKEVIELSKAVNQLADNLKNQELLRKRLTGDVAHELRTPLTTLQSHLEAMIDGVWQPDKERLGSCHEEIMRLNRMVTDIDKLAKAEAESLILNKVNFDLTECVRGIAINFENDFKIKGVELSVLGEGQQLFADKDKTCQIIINILSNALKYSLQGAKVEVEIYCKEDKVRFSTIDSGIGISSEDLPFIFERFYRADKSRNRNTGGRGLGLTITKTLVEAHNGKIFIESELNKGTKVVVEFPKNA